MTRLASPGGDHQMTQNRWRPVIWPSVLVLGILQAWLSSTTHPPVALRVIGIVYGAAGLIVIVLLIVGWLIDLIHLRAQGVPVSAQLRHSSVSAFLGAMLVVLVLAFVAGLAARLL